jgi:hypothetical protein
MRLYQGMDLKKTAKERKKIHKDWMKEKEGKRRSLQLKKY